jgi:predicted GNAT family acetyltransferase
MEITRHDEATRGRYEARVDGHDEAAELTFSKLGEKTLIADHTGVPESLRGQGVGQALVERLVADAREQGFKIVPLCPFVKAQYGRHPEWSDVMD